MYKYIFCDLYGTLLDDDKKISRVNLAAIEKARANDYVCANGSLVHLMAKIL